MKKALTAILAALMLASTLLTSCGGGEASSTEVSTTPTATETTEAVETEIPDDLPDANYDGHTYTILTYSPSVYYIEEATGDIVDDAKYERNSLIAERFNVEIAVNAQAGIQELNGAAISSVLAGEDVYDIMIPHQITSGPGFITSHILCDWNNVPYINTDKPWWNQSINDTINILGKQFYLAGAITLPSPFCLFFNKSYVSNYNLEDIYTVVNEGRWTLDYFADLLKTLTADVNGDGVLDENDRWGLSINNDNQTLNFMYGCDQLSVIIDDTGYPQVNVDNSKMLTIIDKVYNIIYNDNRTWYTTYATQSVADAMFRDGRLFMKGYGVGDAMGLRDSDIEFGIIPYPKYDEEQTAYHTHVDAWNGMICVPVTATNLERTGVITEAMAAYTYKLVTPVYYDVALTSKYLRDDESVAMLDIIFDGILYDFGYIFDNWKGTTWTLPNLMVKKSTDFASHFASKEKAIMTHYEQLYEAVLTYDDN